MTEADSIANDTKKKADPSGPAFEMCSFEARYCSLKVNR